MIFYAYLMVSYNVHEIFYAYYTLFLSLGLLLINIQLSILLIGRPAHVCPAFAFLEHFEDGKRCSPIWKLKPRDLGHWISFTRHQWDVLFPPKYDYCLSSLFINVILIVNLPEGLSEVEDVRKVSAHLTIAKGPFEEDFFLSPKFDSSMLRMGFWLVSFTERYLYRVLHECLFSRNAFLIYNQTQYYFWHVNKYSYLWLRFQLNLHLFPWLQR